jgi:prepilin peptidase CpaA
VTPVLFVPMLAASVVALSAVFTDVRWHRVPNWLTGAGLCLGLVGNLVLGGLSSGGSGALSAELSAVAGAGLGFVLLFPLYAIRVKGLGRAMGAGDVKLLVGLGAIVGPQALVSVAVYGALAGAVQSLVILANHGTLKLLLQQTLVLGSIPTPALSGRKAPYAVAIAAGVCLTMVLPPIVRF